MKRRYLYATEQNKQNNKKKNMKNVKKHNIFIFLRTFNILK